MDGRVRELGKAVALLGDIQSKQGVYFTTGNHEYLSGMGRRNELQFTIASNQDSQAQYFPFRFSPLEGGVDELFQFLSHHGVRSLHNSNVKIFGKNGKDFLYIVGTDDVFADVVQ